MGPSPKTILRTDSATAGATNTQVIDRLNYDYAVIDIGLTGASATTAATEVALQDSDVTNPTTFANVTGFVGGTAFTIPTAIRTAGNNSQGPTVVRLGVDCRSRKRYLRTVVAAGGTTTITVAAHLGRGDSMLETAAGVGADVLANG